MEIEVVIKVECIDGVRGGKKTAFPSDRQVKSCANAPFIIFGLSSPSFRSFMDGPSSGWEQEKMGCRRWGPRGPHACPHTLISLIEVSPCSLMGLDDRICPRGEPSSLYRAVLSVYRKHVLREASRGCRHRNRATIWSKPSRPNRRCTAGSLVQTNSASFPMGEPLGNHPYFLRKLVLQHNHTLDHIRHIRTAASACGGGFLGVWRVPQSPTQAIRGGHSTRQSRAAERVALQWYPVQRM